MHSVTLKVWSSVKTACLGLESRQFKSLVSLKAKCKYLCKRFLSANDFVALA